MPEVLYDNLYNYPKYYDLVFGSDWKAEFDFLRACFRQYAERPVRRLFEPACGTGRLMFRFARAGYEVAGNDLNRHAVDYCNRRLERHGFPATAVCGDMADFRLRRKADAAFNTINSFRHLSSDRAAEDHLRCLSRALRKGGLYVLGIHLTPTQGERVEEEAWSARRGHLVVNSWMRSCRLDLRQRREVIDMTFDVYTPRRHLRLVDQMEYRTYTAEQMRRLLNRIADLEVVATYDFTYAPESPIRIDAATEDVVFVLRKT